LIADTFPKRDITMQLLASVLIATLYILAGSSALAGAVTASAPEIDPSALAPVASGITGVYLIYRMFRIRRSNSGKQ
jgi:hypothetical protein